MIQSACAISLSVSTFLAPPEPLVSILTLTPAALAAFSIPSAAIYVCAIPVGHDVTARIFFPDSLEIFVFSSLSSISGFSSSALSMIARNSSTDLASLSDFENSSSIIRTDSLLRTSRWTLSSVSGAAIRKRSVTGSPSSESKSTPSLITIAASPGLSTAPHFP